MVLGRGIDMMFDAFGLPRIKTAEIEDFVGIMRQAASGRNHRRAQGACWQLAGAKA